MKREMKAVIVSIVMAIPLWIMLFLALSMWTSTGTPLTFPLPPKKNLKYMESSYYPVLNVTTVKFGNVGHETLYNITVVSEFGDANDFPMPVKPGYWFQVALPGQVSKATVYYATEPNGPKVEENFEWVW